MKKFGKLAVLAALVLALSVFTSCSNSSSDSSSGGALVLPKYTWKGDSLYIGGVSGNYVLTAYTNGTWIMTGTIPSLNWSGTGGMGTWVDNGNGTANIVTTHWANYSNGQLEPLVPNQTENNVPFNEDKIVFTYQGPPSSTVTLTKTGSGASASAGANTSTGSSSSSSSGTTEVTQGKTYTAKLGKNITGWANRGTVLGTVTITGEGTFSATSNYPEGWAGGDGTYDSAAGTYYTPTGGSSKQGTYSIEGDVIWLTPTDI